MIMMKFIFALLSVLAAALSYALVVDQLYLTDFVGIHGTLASAISTILFFVVSLLSLRVAVRFSMRITSYALSIIILTVVSHTDLEFGFLTIAWMLTPPLLIVITAYLVFTRSRQYERNVIPEDAALFIAVGSIFIGMTGYLVLTFSNVGTAPFVPLMSVLLLVVPLFETTIWIAFGFKNTRMPNAVKFTFTGLLICFITTVLLMRVVGS